MNQFIEELKWRGMLHDIMPGTEDILSNGMTSAYIGFDPTADSLHVGSLAQIMTLIHFQKAGHKPFALVGGATGMVGDPSGKSQERNLLSEDILQKNLIGIKNQLSKFLDFDCGDNSAVLVNNHDWFKDFNLLDFIRDIGKHITVNYMMSKDSVKNRIGGEGMSFTEFTYQLIQGFDFFHLWKNHNCKLQMGGSDQWGNILTGSELIRRKEGGEAFALTTNLIKKADRTKFGKSESGNIWLDPEKTSPFKFFQFWLNSSDEDAKNFIKIFTLLDKESIDDLLNDHNKNPHLRIIQKALAIDVTTRVHGEVECRKAIASAEFLFTNSDINFLKTLSREDILDIFTGVDTFEVEIDSLVDGVNVIDMLATQTPIFPSKNESRKMINGGGVSINRTKVDVNKTITVEDLINDEFIVAQKGKKSYFLIIAK